MMPSIWGTSLEEHRALVLERLLDAFAELVRERGVEGTTLAAVAERAGLARSAIYNHVRDKHDLVLAHTERGLKKAAEQLHASHDTSQTADRRLDHFVRTAFHSWIAEPGASADLVSQLDEAQRVRLFSHLAPMTRMLRGIVEAGIAEGTFRAAPPDHLTGFVSATLEGYRRSLSDDADADADELADVVVALLLDGLSGPS
jgi:AcrR family transcriptional regulator